MGMYIVAAAFFAAGAVVMAWVLLVLVRPRPEPPWELKVTTPEGTVADTTTGELDFLWRSGQRTNDGYFEVYGQPGLRVWVKPEGWQEPDRMRALDGTAALPERYRR